jgi:putative acetyltransferase
MHAFTHGGASVRRIRPEDDASIAAVIRTVMPEFGAEGPGFAIHDPEVDCMSAAYPDPRALYLVVELDGRVVGGGGVGPLAGADDGTCELRKMYFLKEARGRGLGRRLIEHCITAARGMGYRSMYLETLTGMDAAQNLYERLGFRRLDCQLGATGHFACDRYYALTL